MRSNHETTLTNFLPNMGIPSWLLVIILITQKIIFEIYKFGTEGFRIENNLGSQVAKEGLTSRS